MSRLVSLHGWFLILSLLVGLPACQSSTKTNRQVLENPLPVLIFNGKVLNDMGEAISGAKVQFWQTDSNGNYNHPSGSNNGGILDNSFQYFGTSTTIADGSFSFVTRRPGIYIQRPVTHIHFKVWVDGVDVLTSQFYFKDENTSYSNMLILELEEFIPEGCAVSTTGLFGVDCSETVYITEKTIVVDMGLGGTVALTPSQQAGPFYPVIDFMDYDFNLLNTTASTGTPELTLKPTLSPSSLDTTDNSPTTITTDSKTSEPTDMSSSPPSASTGTPQSTLKPSFSPSSLDVTDKSPPTTDNSTSSSSDDSSGCTQKIMKWIFAFAVSSAALVAV